MARVLAISSQVARGHVGLSAIVPALQGLGHEVIGLPTVLLSNHPGHKVVAGERVSPALLRRMLDALEANGWLGEIEAVTTAYLPSVEHVQFAVEAIGRVKAQAIGARALFTEREAGIMTLRRGFRLSRGERVLVVEDVVTTGGSTRETIEAVVNADGVVIGAGSMVDRSGGAVDVGVRRQAMLTLDVPSYDPLQCPMCKEGVPAIKPGSRGFKQ